MIRGAFSWRGISLIVHLYMWILGTCMINFADEKMLVWYVFQHVNDLKHTPRIVIFIFRNRLPQSWNGLRSRRTRIP